MVKILITGGSGFIGNTIVSMLANNNSYELLTISKKKIRINGNNVVHKEIDLNNYEEVNYEVKKYSADILLHLAWYTNHEDYLYSESNLDWIQSSIVLFNAFQKAGGKKIIVTGSCEEYSYYDLPLGEESMKLNYNNLYAITKNTTRFYLEQYCKKYNIQFVWCRLFYVYGPGENRKKFFPLLISSILQKKEFISTGSHHFRDYIHVYDVSKALFHFISHSNIESGIYNIGSGNAFNIKDIINDVIRYSNMDYGDKLLKYINGNSKSNTIYADIRKIQNTGWRPSVPLFDGIIQYINYIKDNQLKFNK